MNHKEALAKIEELEAEVTLLGGTVGRFVSENNHHRTSARRNYEARRRLENAIRKHATRQCGCRTDRQCMAALARLVPVYARPAYKSRVKAKAPTKK